MSTKAQRDTDHTSPIAQRWELARRLKELRVQHKRSLEDVARELMCSTAKVSRMETGARGIQRRDVRDLCRYYTVPAKVEHELMTLAEDASRVGWWSQFRTLNDETTAFVGLESAATESWTSNTLVIPGLLQTAEYSARLLEHLRPREQMPEDAQAERVELRQRRQERLADGALRLWSVIDEAALAREIGDTRTRNSQIDRLIERAQLNNITIQVIPFSIGAHPGLDGSFHYLRFAPGTVDDVVYVEGHLGMFLVDKPTDTERYKNLFEDISQKYALSPEASLEWLQRLSRTMTAR